ALGKCVAQTFDDLKQRQVNVSEPSPDHILAAVVLEHAFEIAQKLRRAMAPEIGRAPLRRRLLLLVIEPAGNRVMRVVNVYDQIRDGELQLVRPQPSGLVARRKVKPRTKIKQNEQIGRASCRERV